MKKIILKIIIFNIIIFSVFGSELKVKTFEEGTVYLRINKKYGETFFPVLFRGEGREVYIDVEEVLKVIEVNTLKYDSEKKEITGYVLQEDPRNREDIKSLDIDENLEKLNEVEFDGKTYVEAESLSRVLPLEYIYWDKEAYLLELKLGFLNQMDINERYEKNKRGLTSKNGVVESEVEYLKPKRKIFSAGVAQIKYLKHNFLEDDEDEGFLELNYYNQFLYGDLQLQTSILPEFEFEYATLSYKDLVKDYYLEFGNTSLQTDQIFNVDTSNFRGFSIYKNNIWIEKDNETIDIEGSTLNGTVVELYQYNILVDVADVRSNVYEFENVPYIGFSDKYTLKFFYPDGTYEEREISILNDYEIQGKGEGDFIFQGGEADSNWMLKTKYLYGVTENLTLGAGFFQGKADESEVDDFTYSNVEANILYRTSAKKNPTLYSLKAFADLKTHSGQGEKGSNVTYKAGISKSLLWHDWDLFYEDYSNTILNTNDLDLKYGVNISNNISNFSYLLGYEHEKLLEEEADLIKLNLRYYWAPNWRYNLDNTYYRFIESVESEEDYISSRLGIGYSGFERVNINLYGEYQYNSNEVVDSYEVRVSSKDRNLGKGDLSYSIFGTYVPRDDAYSIGFSFEYYLYDWLSIPGALINTNDDTNYELGVSLDKTIILSEYKRQSSNPTPENGWLEGKVFIDSNGNNIYDQGEEVVTNSRIFQENRDIKTDMEGNYYIDDIPSNIGITYTVDYRDFDPMYKPIKSEYSFVLNSASGMTLDIPLLPVSAIIGDIGFENSERLSQSELDLAYQQTKIYLIEDGEVVKEEYGEMGGFFILEDILPGNYSMEIKYLGSRGYRVVTEAKIINIERETTGEFLEGFNFYLGLNEEQMAILEKELEEKEKEEEKTELKEMAPTKEEVSIYKIQAGDTLAKISKRKNITIRRLMSLNSWIKNSNEILYNRELLLEEEEYSYR